MVDTISNSHSLVFLKPYRGIGVLVVDLVFMILLSLFLLPNKLVLAFSWEKSNMSSSSMSRFNSSLILLSSIKYWLISSPPCVSSSHRLHLSSSVPPASFADLLPFAHAFQRLLASSSSSPQLLSLCRSFFFCRCFCLIT